MAKTIVFTIVMVKPNDNNNDNENKLNNTNSDKISNEIINNEQHNSRNLLLLSTFN